VRARRGFSILEILIAMSLVSLVAALVIPISIGAIARASAQEAQPRLEAAVAEARLEAARLGVPVRLVASRGGAVVRIEALEMPRRGEARGNTVEAFGSEKGAPAGGFGGLNEDSRGAAGRSAGEWVLLNEISLPKGIVLATAPREGVDFEEAALGVFTMSSTVGDGEGGGSEEPGAEAWTFATALPDGRLEPAGERLIVRAAGRGDAAERRWTVAFAAWTGAVTLTAIREDDDALAEREEEAFPPPPPGSASRGAREGS
jgi:prepilin-type N-terminal cleavage/methylation domain-containing protein